MTDLPQGYEPHEIPADYTGPLFLESQMRAVIEAEREACAKACEKEIARVKPIYSVTAENCVKAIRARGEEG